jgi:hypothetical protein
MDAGRAAEQIVQAVKRKEAERILSLPANIAVRLHGVFPGVSVRLAGVVNRWVLPGADPNVAARERGAEIERGRGSELFKVATAWGRAAAQRTNQYKAED